MEPPEDSPSTPERAVPSDALGEPTAPLIDDPGDVESAPEGAHSERDDENWLSPGVVSVGAASFFSDSGHEIATALLPSFVTSVLHSSAAALGVIEGVSDALMGVMKLVAGRWANDSSRRGCYRRDRPCLDCVASRRAAGLGLDGPGSSITGS
jgi:hypothetical protein